MSQSSTGGAILCPKRVAKMLVMIMALGRGHWFIFGLCMSIWCVFVFGIYMYLVCVFRDRMCVFGMDVFVMM